MFWDCSRVEHFWTGAGNVLSVNALTMRHSSSKPISLSIRVDLDVMTENTNKTAYYTLLYFTGVYKFHCVALYSQQLIIQ